MGSGAAGSVSTDSTLSISGSLNGVEDAVISTTSPEGAGHMGGGAGLVYSNANGKVTIEQSASINGGQGAYTSGGGTGMVMVYGGEAENHGTIQGGSVWNNGTYTIENSGAGGAGLFMVGADGSGIISGNSSGGSLNNFGLIQGGNGGDLNRESTANGTPPNQRAMAGAAGNGITANNAFIHNRVGALILGGTGGENIHANGTTGNTPGAGDGGHGIQIYSKNASLRTVVINDGTITGGTGGVVNVLADHRAGMGGHGIVVYGDNTYIFNTGTIQGGASGNKLSALPGDGIRVSGASTYVINAGHIAAGIHATNLSVLASAIDFRTSNNVLELRNGWSFDGSVIGSPTEGNTLALGGPAQDDVTFDQSGIKPNGIHMNPAQFRDFDFYAKVGEATWTITGTPVNNSPDPAHLLRWDVYGGTLKVESAIAGSEVFGGVLEPANPSAKLGNVTVYGPGTGGHGFFAGQAFSGGAIALGKGGQAGFVNMMSGSSIYAYPNNMYLEAGDHFTAANGIKLVLRGTGWQKNTDYKLIHSANAANTIAAEYAGDGVLYKTVGYEYKLYHKNFGVDNDALHLFMLSPHKNIVENPGLSDNQQSTGNRVDSLLDDDMFKDLVRNMTPDEYRYASDQLSGEIYASVPTVLREQDQQLRNRVLNRGYRNHLYSTLCDQPATSPEDTQNATANALPEEITAADSSLCLSGDCSDNQDSDAPCLRNDLWMSLDGTYSEYRSNSNTAKTTLQGLDFAFGIDRAFANGWGGGAFFRYGDKNMEVKSRHSELDIHSYSLGLYGSKNIAAGPGALRFTLGGIYGYHELDGSRKVRFATINESHKVDYKAHSYTLFSEAAFLVPLADIFWAEPFANLTYTGVKTESAKEYGGETAVRAWSDSHDALESRLGVRLSLPVYKMLSLDAELAWQHYFSDTANLNIGFTRGGRAYKIKGTPSSSDAFVVGLGARLQLSKAVDISLNYNGSFGNCSSHHAGQAMLTVRF